MYELFVRMYEVYILGQNHLWNLRINLKDASRREDVMRSTAAADLMSSCIFEPRGGGGILLPRGCHNLIGSTRTSATCQ